MLDLEFNHHIGLKHRSKIQNASTLPLSLANQWAIIRYKQIKKLNLQSSFMSSLLKFKYGGNILIRRPFLLKTRDFIQGKVYLWKDIAQTKKLS